MDANEVLVELAVAAVWEIRRDALWVEAPGLDVSAMARLMRGIEARWVTLTVTPASGGGFRLIYHWDLEGKLLNIVTFSTGPRVTSVADIWPAAEWVEREARDYYALEFEGRHDTPALMLRPGDEPGLFSRTHDLGRDADPADADRADAGGES